MTTEHPHETSDRKPTTLRRYMKAITLGVVMCAVLPLVLSLQSAKGQVVIKDSVLNSSVLPKHKFKSYFVEIPDKMDTLLIPYPAKAKAANVGGTVDLSFVIADSTPTDIQIDQADYPELTDGVIDRLKSMTSHRKYLGNSRQHLHLFFDPNHPDRAIRIVNGRQALD